jgi:heme-degrading monooxygenase HmoA
MAAYLIAKHWIHGEAFRKWFNLDLDPVQGAKANERENVLLNPSVMIFGGGEENES